jgi:integrase/recombinase XerD
MSDRNLIHSSSTELVEALNDEKLIELWLADRPHNTACAYGRAIALLQAHLQGKPLAQVQFNELATWKGNLEGKPATMAAAVRAVKSFYSCVSRIFPTYIANVAAKLRIPPVSDQISKNVLYEEDSKTVRSQLRKEEAIVQAMILLGICSGRRVSEVTGLRWSDVSEVQVDAGKGTSGGVAAVLRVLAKGGNYEYCELTPEQWNEIRQLLPTPWGHNEPLLGWWVDRPTGELRSYSRHSCYRRAVRVTKAALGASGARCFHALRHTHATLALRGGASTLELRRQCGWKSERMLNRYVHQKAGEGSAYSIPL